MLPLPAAARTWTAVSRGVSRALHCHAALPVLAPPVHYVDTLSLRGRRTQLTIVPPAQDSPNPEAASER